MAAMKCGASISKYNIMLYITGLEVTRYAYCVNGMMINNVNINISYEIKYNHRNLLNVSV